MDRVKFRRGFRIGRRLRATAVFILVGLRLLAGRNLRHLPWYLWVFVGFASVVLLIWTAFDAVPSGGSDAIKSGRRGL